MQEKSPTTDKQHKDQGNDSNVANRIPSDNKQLVEEAYDLLVSLFDGCNSQYVPELLQGLCDEIVSVTHSHCFLIYCKVQFIFLLSF